MLKGSQKVCVVKYIVVFCNIKLRKNGEKKIMKYYIHLFGKWYAFICIFISCQKNFFMVDKKCLRGKQRQISNSLPLCEI